MDLVVSRFDLFLVALDPTVGHEIRKTRPCVVISPDEMNHYIGTIIVAPMTTATKTYASRVNVEFQGRTGQIVLDQIRAVDRSRLVKKLGTLRRQESRRLLQVLASMFAP